MNILGRLHSVEFQEVDILGNNLTKEKFSPGVNTKGYLPINKGLNMYLFTTIML